MANILFNIVKKVYSPYQDPNFNLGCSAHRKFKTEEINSFFANLGSLKVFLSKMSLKLHNDSYNL